MRWGMGRFAVVAGACAVCVGAVAGVSVAADVGANDSTATFVADGGATFYREMAALGLKQSVLTVRFHPAEPTAIQNQGALDAAVEQATAAGLKVVFSVYPYPPRELAQGLGTPAAFASWLRLLATRYPQVRQYVVGNEPNQTAFVRPQFRKNKRNASAATAGAYLAAGYDALKAVNPAVVVIGVGLSPRGNDDPGARDNPSVSPLRFLSALGRWYRASGRTRPLMDGFSFHPYPRKATDPLSRGYDWPNAGFPNLARIKQGLWDAFHGTAQPTTVNGLKLYLDEVGWQVGTGARVGYLGAENVPVTTEAQQAAIYGALVRQAACDPSVAEVNFFGFYDDGLRTGFQAGLYRADGSPRPAADAVRAAIAETSRGCAGDEAEWTPAVGVSGATVTGLAFTGLFGPVLARTPFELEIDTSATEGARATAWLERLSMPPIAHRRGLFGATTAAVAETAAAVRPPGTARILISLPRGLPAGRYAVTVRLAAEGDPTRVTRFTGTPFIVF
jgi:hypothetical protein